ncbi:MAG: hypothetical protein ACOCUS_00585 [Polyangiales bacterium]
MSTTAEQKASEGTREEPAAGSEPEGDGEGTNGNGRHDAAEAASEPEAAETESENGSEGGSEEAGSWSAGGLSPEEAERLAAGFKAPWEEVDADPGWGAGDAQPAAPAADGASGGGPTPADDEEQAETTRQPPATATPTPSPSTAADATGPVPAVPTRKPDRNVWIVAGVVGVALVVGLVAALSAGDDSSEPVAEAASEPVDEGAEAADDEGADDSTAGEAGEGGEPTTASDEGADPESSSEAEASDDGQDASSSQQDEATSEQEAAEPATVQVTLRTVPADATLLVDGTKVANPYDVELEHSDAEHRVVARKSGYETAQATLAFDQDVSETLELERKRAPRAERSSSRTERRQRPRRGGSQRQGRSSGKKSAGFVTDNPY